MRNDDAGRIMEKAPVQGASELLLYQTLLMLVRDSAELIVSNAYLARRIHRSKRTVIRLFKKLESAGLVVSTEIAPGRGMRRRLTGLHGWVDDKGPRWKVGQEAPDGGAEPPAEQERGPAAALALQPPPTPRAARAENAAPETSETVVSHPSAGAGAHRRKVRHLAKAGPLAGDFGAQRRLARDFEPAAETWAEIKALNLSEQQVEREIAKFIDYFGPGGKGQKTPASNWDWKLVDWMQRAEKYHSRHASAPAAAAPSRPASPPSDDEIAAAQDRLKRAFKPAGVRDVLIGPSPAGQSLKGEAIRPGARSVLAFGADLDAVCDQLAEKLGIRARSA